MSLVLKIASKRKSKPPTVASHETSYMRNAKADRRARLAKLLEDIRRDAPPWAGKAPWEVEHLLETPAGAPTASVVFPIPEQTQSEGVSQC